MPESRKEMSLALRLQVFIMDHADEQFKPHVYDPNCKCLICDLEQLIKDIRQYGDKTSAIAVDLQTNRDILVLTSVQELGLTTITGG